MSKVWFITGASSGFGREFALAALRRGDKVAATSRSLAGLASLSEDFGESVLPLEVDLTDAEAAKAAVRDAAKAFGRLDVVVNNAGYGHNGYVEELSEADLRAQMDVNFMAPIFVAQAAVPVMRAQGAGHIIQISSIAGLLAFPAIGAYSASKWALEAVSESLAQEVAQFGIKVTIVEPGGYRTGFQDANARHSEELPPYRDAHAAAAEMMKDFDYSGTPIPQSAAPALLKLVDAERPPLRVFFSSFVQPTVASSYAARLDEWDEWKWLAAEAERPQTGE